MPEQDWNNNGAAIDAMLSDAGLNPAQPVDDTPVATGPFEPKVEPRILALEKRVAKLEEETAHEGSSGV